MKIIIKKIEQSVLKKYPNATKIELHILYSKNHNSISIKINDTILDFEIDTMQLLEIDSFIKNIVLNKKYNKLLIIDDLIQKSYNEIFSFDFDYYIKSNYNLFVNRFKSQKDFEDTIKIAKDAVLKSNILKLTSKMPDKCNLYIAIDKGQIVTDIEPNSINNENNYLPLCSLTKQEKKAAGQSLNEFVKNKIEENYF